jgi:hypothetical protein
MTVQTPTGGLEITEISFLADDPRALVATARKRMSAALPDRRARQ